MTSKVDPKPYRPVGKFHSTAGDGTNRASVIDGIYGKNEESVVFRGIEGRNGIEVSLEDANNGIGAFVSKKIVVALPTTPPVNSPFVRKIGDQMTGNLTFSNSSGARLLLAKTPIATPPMSFLSDQDTGIASPLNNTLVFVTDGNERVRIDANGNVTFSGTGAVNVHTGTTAQRPTSPVPGAFRLNTSNNLLETFIGSSWRDIITTATPPTAPGEVLQWNGTTYVWGTATASATVDVVPNIAARNALTPILGRVAFVVTAPDGEWAMYICTQVSPTTVWTEIANYDSAQSDSKTRSVMVPFSAASPVLISNVSDESRVHLVVVEVLTAFNDPSATLVVGDSIVNNRLMQASLVDLTTAGNYVATPNYIYSGIVVDEPIYVYLNAGTSTTGLARVSITWS